MESVSAWEGIFMLVVLKIPIFYLAVVVWWAIRAEPAGWSGSEPVGVLAPLDPCDWDSRRRSAAWRASTRRPRPLGPGTRALPRRALA